MTNIYKFKISSDSKKSTEILSCYGGFFHCRQQLWPHQTLKIQKPLEMAPRTTAHYLLFRRGIEETKTKNWRENYFRLSDVLKICLKDQNNDGSQTGAS